MKSQISRITLQPEKRYSGVYQQQGRMITDADWNEASDLEKQRLADALEDAIASGAPRTGGLEVVSRTTLRPGVLYVDGILARLPGDPAGTIPYQSQPDFPEVIPPPAGDFTLYADVWERTVTALEDPRLVDPGLHGADTCTRTQTMLQIKACPGAGTNPATLANNPALGNARLTAKLRQVSTSADLCDPCADEIDVDERVGNYLFRVEVHDVRLSGTSTIVELKWSRDNGAEQFAVDGAPADFQQGPWSFEFYDDTCEKHLGVHLATDFTPRRGQLVTGYTVPATGPRTYARQWDGHCQIDLTAKTLVTGGQDRGVPLTTSGSDTAPGFVKIETTAAGTTFSVNLDLLELTLELSQGTTDRVFVAGDHWLAEVREAVASSGDYVLGAAGAGVPPAGIRHHYLKLASFNATGALIAQTDEERRRFHFPALTDLEAADVEFTNHCPAEVTLFAGARNVQQALDALCGIAADDIAWTAPTCPAPSVASLLQATPGWSWAGQDGDASRLTVNDALTALLCKLDAARLPYTTGDCGATGPATVRSLLGLAAGSRPVAEVLDALLCNLRATDVPLDKTSTICSTLDDAGIVTVQDALKALCDRPTDGCSRTIRTTDELKLAFGGADRDLNLCLLPGTYQLAAGPAPGKRCVKLSGAGSAATTIILAGDRITLAAEQLQLENIGFAFDRGDGALSLSANELSVTGCLLHRSSANDSAPPMVQISPTGMSPRAYWQNNHLISRYFQITLSDFNATVPGALVGAAIHDPLAEMAIRPSVLEDPQAFETRIDVVAPLIERLPAPTRTNWARALSSQPIGTAAPRADIDPGGLWRWVFKGPMDQATARATVRARLGELSRQSARETAAAAIAAAGRLGYTAALALTSTAIDLTLVDNIIEGDVMVLNGGATVIDPGRVDPLSINIDHTISCLTASSVAGRLEVRGNQLQRLSFQVPTSAPPSTINIQVPGFSRAAFSHNQLAAAGSALVARFVTVDGNNFAAGGRGLIVISDQCTLLGNTGAPATPLTSVQVRTLAAPPVTSGFAQAANVGLGVVPL